MKNYNEYTVEDFVQDPSFRQWVLDHTPDSKAFWESWVLQNPEQKETIDLAKSMILGLRIKEIPVSTHDIERGIEHILAQTESYDTPIVSIFQRSWFRIAAAIALFVSVGLWWTLSKASKDNFTEGVVNTETQSKKVTLPDGSTVVLEKNSEIHYAKDFARQFREVQFKGEGLFDVVKDPNKPFIVNTGNVITKVLGTSFTVKSFDNDNQITVNVIRGKVSVVALKTKTTQQNAKEEVILVPNQKAVFSKNEARLEQTIVDKPIALVSNDTAKQIIFEEQPVSTIFEALEKTYNVDIVFDNKILKNCAITTTLTDEPLFEKLNAICKSIGATYKVIGVQVIVEGASCN